MVATMTGATNQAADHMRQCNELIGERVHALMWRSRRTQKQLGAILGVDQGSISNRLRGKTNWTAVEIAVVARWLGVPVADLIPEVDVDDPSGPSGAGFRIAGRLTPVGSKDSLPRKDSNLQPFG
ncbi:helix-turn-helix domain-containing protein [Mycobacterium xenopi]|uniref:helix-turn-helix domain-containing protein n=2 Tax=Mycobacterium TaxID=1763 RepID=UPI000DD515EB